MAEPPSYEESTSEYTYQASNEKADSKIPQRFSIREEVSVSRAHHVAALVTKLLPQVRERARRGFSKSNLMLLPSNQDCSRKGELVGIPEDEPPVILQLEGDQDTLEFWTQQEAVDQLQKQLLDAMSDSVPLERIAQSLPARSQPPPGSKSSFFGRKSKSSDVRSLRQSITTKPPVSVTAQLDEVHFRSENDYGLYETHRGRCVLVTVEVR